MGRLILRFANYVEDKTRIKVVKNVVEKNRTSTKINIVYFKDANGAVYKYTCKAIEALSPNAVDEMTTGDWDMTLFTCTYNGANRLAYRFVK